MKMNLNVNFQVENEKYRVDSIYSNQRFQKRLKKIPILILLLSWSNIYTHTPIFLFLIKIKEKKYTKIRGNISTFPPE